MYLHFPSSCYQYLFWCDQRFGGDPGCFFLGGGHETWNMVYPQIVPNLFAVGKVATERHGDILGDLSILSFWEGSDFGRGYLEDHPI